MYPSEANEARYIYALSQIHEGPNEELQHGGAKSSLGPDKDSKPVDQREYRSMIDSLLYLIVT
jgi:hypothetical protein